MGRKKSIKANDACFEYRETQAVTWANWAEDGLTDPAGFNQNVINAIEKLDSSKTLIINQSLLQVIPALGEVHCSLFERSQLRVYVAGEPGLGTKHAQFDYSAMELVAGWRTLSDSFQLYCLYSIYHALVNHRSGFTRTTPQLTVAGMVAICTAVGIGTKRE